MRPFFCAVTLATLSGCVSTTSFSPPNVNLKREVGFSEAAHHCGAKVVGATDLTHDVDGARKLIDNFVIVYRCAAHSAADGRQWFEVPSFLTLTGSAVATALGAGTTVPILATAGSGVLNGANSYWSPKQKADIYDSALDALLCIKTESVGIDAVTVAKISNAQEQQQGDALMIFNEDETVSDPEVSVAADKQYYDLVAASLLSVERVLSQRLSAAGTAFDSEGVISQIKELTREKEEGRDEAEQEAEAAADALTADAEAAAAVADAQAAIANGPVQQALFNAKSAQLRAIAAQRETIKDTILKLKTLKPKLQECVVRAKV